MTESDDPRPVRRLTLLEDGQIQEVQQRRPRSTLSGWTVAAWTVIGAILPGVGLIRAGRRRAGGIILGIFLLGLIAMLGWALFARSSLIRTVLDPAFLTSTTWFLIASALLWVALIICTHLALRGDRPSPRRRIGGAALVMTLTFGICAPLAIGAQYARDSSNFVAKVFKKDVKSATKPTAIPDSWADKPRLNVLLLGGDGDKGRVGVRTDTVMVASIDTHTGDTTLISLPRNTARMPFPKGPLREAYPDGYTDGNGDNPEFMLNSMYDNVPAAHPGILGETDNMGADVMKLSVGEALGLQIDYYVLVEIQQFVQLINAFGGVTVNINEYVAIGGETDRGIPPHSYLSPGPNQHLDGYKGMWFARGRYGADDFQRMDRQRCTINALVRQVNPQTILTRYEAITKASGDILQTDIPQGLLQPLAELAPRVQSGKMRSLVFKHGLDGFSSSHPDWDVVRDRVAAAIASNSDKPQATEQPSAQPTKPTDDTPQDPQPTSEPTTAPDGDDDEGTESPAAPSGRTGTDADDACAYDPEKAEKAKANPPVWAR